MSFERLRALASRALPPESAGGVAYGLILIGALLAAESGHHEGYPDTIGSALLATVLYWLAHGYSTALAERVRSGGRLSIGVIWDALRHDAAIVRGAAIPVIALILAWLAHAHLETAVTAAVWSASAGILGLEVLAGFCARASPRELGVDVVLGATLGLTILGLKALLQ